LLKTESAMHYVGRRTSETNPLRSLPLFRPVYLVLGVTEQQKAEAELHSARHAVPILEDGYAAACAALGQANRMRWPQRRVWQARAFRSINRARAELRAAKKRLTAAERAMAIFAIAKA
jgi:hypothetical protein